MGPPPLGFKSCGLGVEWHEPIIFLRPEVIEIGDHVRVDSFVKLEGGEGLVIGPRCHIPSFAHLNIGGGRLELGQELGICGGAKVLSGITDLSFRTGSPMVGLDRRRDIRLVTRIGDWAYIGINAVVLPGLTVGEGAVLGAGAVLTKDLPPWEVWAGVPARRIGLRQIGTRR